MKLIVLASGSKGNATYLEIGQEKILIDCGITYKQLTTRLAERGMSIDEIAVHILKGGKDVAAH